MDVSWEEVTSGAAEGYDDGMDDDLMDLRNVEDNADEVIAFVLFLFLGNVLYIGFVAAITLKLVVYEVL